MEKQLDDQVHKIVKTKENGKNGEKNFFKGIKEEELEALEEGLQCAIYNRISTKELK